MEWKKEEEEQEEVKGMGKEVGVGKEGRRRSKEEDRMPVKEGRQGGGEGGAGGGARRGRGKGSSATRMS